MNNKARVVAGYCWDWNSEKDPAAMDITIPEYNFKKQWNLNSQKNLWIIEKDSVEQIGCIHTCQGLEVDYIGVIIGPDMRYENGRVITDVTRRSGNDQSMKGFKSKVKSEPDLAAQEADEIIKNTYRTLMTRGMKGCYVYFCDKALAEHFASSMDIPEDRPSVVRIEPAINDEVKFVDFLPLYSIRAACGYFGEGEAVEESGWIKVDGMAASTATCSSSKPQAVQWNPSYTTATIVFSVPIPPVAAKARPSSSSTATSTTLTTPAATQSKHTPVKSHTTSSATGHMKK